MYASRFVFLGASTKCHVGVVRGRHDALQRTRADSVCDACVRHCILNFLWTCVTMLAKCPEIPREFWQSKFMKCIRHVLVPYDCHIFHILCIGSVRNKRLKRLCKPFGFLEYIADTCMQNTRKIVRS